VTGVFREENIVIAIFKNKSENVMPISVKVAEASNTPNYLVIMQSKQMLWDQP
jgi:hypothetical protein